MKRIYDEVLDNINPEELEQDIPESPWRKPLIIATGIFLVLLMVSLSFSDFFQSFVHSSSVEKNTLYFSNATVVFENNVLGLLQDEYISNEDREIKACLFGKVENSLYYIERVEFPEIIRANVIHVVSVGCPVDTLIDLHGHPINSCLASEQDLSMYARIKESYPESRMMIMCSSSRFALI